MKIELEKIHLSVSPLSGAVYVGIINKEGNKWLNKHEVTQMFIDTVIKKYVGKTDIVTDGKDTWSIVVKKIKTPKIKKINHSLCRINNNQNLK